MNTYTYMDTHAKIKPLMTMIPYPLTEAFPVGKELCEQLCMRREGDRGTVFLVSGPFKRIFTRAL